MVCAHPDKAAPSIHSVVYTEPELDRIPLPIYVTAVGDMDDADDNPVVENLVWRG